MAIGSRKVICKCCGKEFDLPNNFKNAVCPECKVSGSVCPICGKRMPYGKKYCSYSCNSKHNLAISNPMNSAESRKKIGDTKRERYGETWKQNAEKREQERQEWLSHAPEREKERVRKWHETVARNGTVFGLANTEVRSRILATAAQNGGMGLANPATREKVRLTSLARYGVENAAQAPEVRAEISKKAKISRNSPEVKEKAIKTLQERYGVSNGYLVGAENRETKFVSAAEDEVAAYVESLGVTVKRHNHSILGNGELDIYCPNYNIAIEYNGVYWHSTKVHDDKYYQSRKTRMCAQKGVRLIHIYEWEWLNPVKQEIIKSLLRVVFQKIEHPIYARQCQIKDVSIPEYREFCNRNHLQGYRYASVIYGLYYNDELVQLMSFSKPQKRGAKEEFQWEIVRGCPGSNNVVVGGVSKLWQHFLRTQNPDTVMSYCDSNKFDGHSYLDIGMTLYKDDPLNVWYVDLNTGKVQQWLFRNKEKRETLLANSLTVYGAGNKTFVWRKPDENTSN